MDEQDPDTTSTGQAEFVRHIDLPSGGSVEFCDPEDLTGDDHRQVVASIKGEMATITEREVAASMDLVCGVACMMINAWDIPYTPRDTAYPPGEVPIPRADSAILGKLRFRDYNTIITAVSPAAQLLFPQPPSPDQAGKPGSPTVPSSD